MTEWWNKEYPSRYYVYPDNKTKINGFPTACWLDLGLYDKEPAMLSNIAGLIALTAEQWSVRLFSNQVIKDGQVATEIPLVPKVEVPLKDQATSENTGWIQAQIAEAAAMGETFSDPMKIYVRAIRAIANGSDTTSTALPARPETVFS